MNPKFTADLRAQPDKTWSPEEEIAYLLDATLPFAASLGLQRHQLHRARDDRADHRHEALRPGEWRFLTPLSLTRIVPSTSRRIPGLIPGYAGPVIHLGCRMKCGQRRVRDQPAVRMAAAALPPARTISARWGHALYTGAALTPKARALMIDAAVPAQLGPAICAGPVSA